MAGKDNFQRYNARQKFRLIQTVFKSEFDIKTLVKAGIVKEHFMTHTYVRYAIVQSWKKHGNSLCVGMLKGQYMNHIEPLNLIANYYGEKYAMYFAFLVHHIGWLIVPSVFGSMMFAYHVYMGFERQEEGQGIVTSVLEHVDTQWNYLYVLLVSIWSTIYVESWKRKQNTLAHIWGLNEQRGDILKQVTREQKGSVFIVDPISGKKEKIVFKETPALNNITTFFFLVFFSLIAFLIWYTYRTLKNINSWIPQEKDFYMISWEYLWTVIYSIAVIYLSGWFAAKAKVIVEKENHKFNFDHENSMIVKSYILAFVNCYLGLFAAAFYDQKYKGLTFLLATILIFKQLILNVKEFSEPYKKFPKKFAEHKKLF